VDLNITSKQREIALWVNQYGDTLYSWAFYNTSNEAISQDLVQETFIAAFQNIKNFKRNSSPKTWLFSILKNKIIDHFRQVAKNEIDRLDENDPWFEANGHWKHEFRPVPWENTGVDLLDDPEFLKALSSCMSKLPDAWNACVQLKYLGEKDSAEICQQLNISASNLWQILHRAKLRLRNCLEINWFKSQ